MVSILSGCTQNYTPINTVPQTVTIETILGNMTFFTNKTEIIKTTNITKMSDFVYTVQDRTYTIYAYSKILLNESINYYLTGVVRGVSSSGLIPGYIYLEVKKTQRV